MGKETPSLTIVAEPRLERGSRAVRRIRLAGWLPCIVYNAEGQSKPIKINRHTFENLVQHHGRRNLIVDLEVGGEPLRKAILRDVQVDRTRDFPTHVDFMEISMTRKIRVSVQIDLVGEPVGVTQQDGVLEHLHRTVEVECLPADIVKSFQIDVGPMKLGDTLFVRDLKVDPKLTILTPLDIPIASVLIPRMEEEVTPEEGAAEPEVIGEVKEGEEGEAAAAEGEKAEGKEKAVPGAKPGAKVAPGAKPGAKATAAPGGKPAAGKEKAPEGKAPEKKGGKK
ncbi:MAG: 50S ribosomal protein L25 [Lentisphaerae bacterium]|nr:50S ribosomal protein L25 [Lentisphaerota bacterium]